MSNICLVIALIYNGGMEHIVEIKVHQVGARIQVIYVMHHINVRIIIWFPVHSEVLFPKVTLHVNVQQINIGYVKNEFRGILSRYEIFLGWLYMSRSSRRWSTLHILASVSSIDKYLFKCSWCRTTL
jgi:hypothetical protein